MPEKHPKRPRDLNQWAKRMVDIATGAEGDEKPETAKRPKRSASTKAVSPSRQASAKKA